MVEIKSHEVDGFLQKQAKHYRIFIVYGPDKGLVAERAKAIAEQTGVDQSDGFALIRLDVADIQMIRVGFLMRSILTDCSVGKAGLGPWRGE